ncbi:MAG: beta-hydroxyacyl-ACP dehydratase [Nitrospirae bacterium]|nr:beta-hydroxyacyl-ACP dehydratase [Nitrospirota bacterium]
MRYLLIDHILEWQNGERIKGIKNVAMSEDFLEFHFPKNPIMPGVMLLEAITQLTGWLEAASSDFQNWFLISRVLKCSFYRFALPGDQVEFEVSRIPGQTGDIHTYSAIGTVKGAKKIVTEFEGELIPLADIEDPEEQRRFFALLTREIRL